MTLEAFGFSGVTLLSLPASDLSICHLLMQTHECKEKDSLLFHKNHDVHHTENENKVSRTECLEKHNLGARDGSSVGSMTSE